MCNKTVCIIDVPGGAQFVLALCAHGFSFIPQNNSAQKILKKENEALRKGLNEGKQPRVFGVEFSNIASQVPQDTVFPNGEVIKVFEGEIQIKGDN